MPDPARLPAPVLTPAAQQTLDTAARLFYDQGIHAVGVDLIARESGVTKKTLYERFGSKENLVLAYLRQREDRWREALAEHLERHPEPGVDRVLAVFDAAAAWFPEHAAKGCGAVNARAESAAAPAPDQRLPIEVTAEKTWMLARFVELVAEAGVAEPERRGRALMLLLEGALVTLATRAFADPLLTARDTARLLLTDGTAA